MTTEADPNKVSGSMRVWTRTQRSLKELVAEKVRRHGRVITIVELLDDLVREERQRMNMPHYD